MLLQTVRAEPDPDRIRALLDVADVDAVVGLARIHRVEGLVHHRLTTSDIPVPRPTHRLLNDLRMAAVAREVVAQQRVARLPTLLDAPFLVVKGPVLGAQWYGGLGLRTYSDLDVLVRAQDFSGALEALTSRGYRELATNWDGFLAHRVSEVPVGDDRMVIDLHWHPIAMGLHRDDISVNVEALFNRAERVVVGSAEVATLDPEDTLVHLCVNSGLGGARRLLQLVDVDTVARSGRINWSVFVKRSRQFGAHALCCAVLQRARTLIGTPIAPELLSELAPFPGWRSGNALIDRRGRGVRQLRRGVASGLLLSAGRSTARRTLAISLRAARDALFVRAGGPTPTGPGGDIAWVRTSGTVQDAVDRRRYLEWVSTSGAARL